MNIFILDTDVTKAVQYCVDSHASKMVLETAQLLCTTLNLLGVETPYKSCHMKHPCRLWTGESSANFSWLCDYGTCLGQEFKYRYGKDHKSAQVIQFCKEYKNKLPVGSMTPFAQAMPDELKGDNAVDAYRRYYNRDKRHLFKWTGRPVPEWVLGFPEEELLVPPQELLLATSP